MMFRGLLVVGAVAVIAGCASIAPSELQKPSVDAFSFSGRIALREQERDLSGGIRWQHNAARDDILLLSPLGQGVMQIERDAGGATLRTADDKTYQAPDAEQLAFEVTGWSIPVSGLSAWVRGVPRPGPAAGTVRDDAGRLTRLTQDDWTIEYPEYFAPPRERVPRRVQLTRPGLTLKLVIDDWELLPPAGAAAR